MSSGVNLGPDLVLRGSVSPLARILTLLPPTSTARMRRGIFNGSDRRKRGTRVEVAPGSVRPLAFGAAHVARGVALEDVDRAFFRARTIHVHRDHAAAARLDRVLDRGRAALAAAYARHRASKGADIGAQAGPERDQHQADVPGARSDPARPAAHQSADRGAE